MLIGCRRGCCARCCTVLLLVLLLGEVRCVCVKQRRALTHQRSPVIVLPCCHCLALLTSFFRSEFAVSDVHKLPQLVLRTQHRSELTLSCFVRAQRFPARPSKLMIVLLIPNDQLVESHGRSEGAKRFTSSLGLVGSCLSFIVKRIPTRVLGVAINCNVIVVHNAIVNCLRRWWHNARVATACPLFGRPKLYPTISHHLLPSTTPHHNTDSSVLHLSVSKRWSV